MKTECTCPSGDGSLRWPCPQHPAAATATGTEAGDLDLDKLEALARAATPGPWESFTEPSFAGWYAIRDPQSESEIGSGDGGLDKPDADFIAAFNPEAALALIALARRTAPATSPHAAPDSAPLPPEATEKKAKLSLSLRADSGYMSDETHRISAEQWGRICKIVNEKE